MSAVVAKLPLSGFIILALLIVQFNSFRKTFIVLSTIPLGLIGSSPDCLSSARSLVFLPFSD